ncbi:hypothetical protein P152DRAFT_410483 [Eremomyces bilateralis CBS 781.70]|uniref:1-phosphatidylinositol 4-kinase n=1 Tax=Eremomyces bilateralis CBS 781.70 TaxID=1392243 RepID=A0A6G1GBX8_9PEZI|nr:uncharacterized protein P152DRAFT_410483 [Eremomyces bilateralis CBS 781.70]KAF1815553.1 hypothetical protein P152DRAFT_410483 [Eremomyces bilateralis CBS 781.70]
MRSIRRQALEKLAALSTSSHGEIAGHADISRLCRRCPGPPAQGKSAKGQEGGKGSVASVPMSAAELESVLALCKAGPSVQDLAPATQLARQLIPYLPESYSQAIEQSHILSGFDSAPWELLTYHLTHALLSLGENHSSIRNAAITSIQQYIDGWEQASAMVYNERLEAENPETKVYDGTFHKILVLAASMVGFMRAATQLAYFWRPIERVQVMQKLESVLSKQFEIALETSLSAIRHYHGDDRAFQEWKRYSKHYAVHGRPLGAMLLREGLMAFVASCSATIIDQDGSLSTDELLDRLFKDSYTPNQPRTAGQEKQEMVDCITDVASTEMDRFDDGSDILELGSVWDQRLAFAAKGNVVKAYLFSTVADSSVCDPDVLMSWIENALSDSIQLADETLATVILKTTTILAKSHPAIATHMSRILPRIIVKGGLQGRVSLVAAEALATVLQRTSEDTVISTLYSLGNVLTSSAPENRTAAGTPFSPFVDGNVDPSKLSDDYIHPNAGSALSLAPSDSTEPSNLFAAVIQAIVCVARAYREEKIIALALSMLVQKIGRVSKAVDARIIAESAVLGPYTSISDFRSLLKQYVRMSHRALVENLPLIGDAVVAARNHLSQTIKGDSEHFEIYLFHILESIVSKGDVLDKDQLKELDTELGAQEISHLLGPLAMLVSSNAEFLPELEGMEGLLAAQRNAWFNLVVHGFSFASPMGKRYLKELQVLAYYSQPLVPKDRTDKLESDIELNIVLRRGKSAEHTVEHKKYLMGALPACEHDIKSLGYPEVVFLTTAYFVETLRARAGNCTTVLTYFLDPRLKVGEMGNCMREIAVHAVNTYVVKTMSGSFQSFSSPYLAEQLGRIFASCCYRITAIQEVAIECADLIISKVPSALCQQTSLFALLDILTIMWDSCLECETDEYAWRATFQTKHAGLEVELSDSYDLRRVTLAQFHKRAKSWMAKVLDLAPVDVKGLLQTYLSEYEEERAYGHLSLGRSFAIELGSTIPTTDQRLNAIDPQPTLGVNTASDFVAQYTIRQGYRFVGLDGTQDRAHGGWLPPDADTMIRTNAKLDRSMEDAESLLADVENRTLNHKVVAVDELRDVLRRAGALLCKSEKDQCAIVHHLVGIPFALFTKQSIKLGISLWTGVIKENPRMESRIIVEVAENWETKIHRRVGLFNKDLHHPNPFYLRQEFAPSDKELIAKKQAAVYNAIAPHFRLLQFFLSHFGASRHSTPQMRRIYLRLVHLSLDAMEFIADHPLAREAHLHLVLLACQLLQHFPGLGFPGRWRLLDRILTAGLAWFSNPPRWSFGGNRLQIKAETHLIESVRHALQNQTAIDANVAGALRAKKELLQMLLSDEQMRLLVWLFPIDYENRHFFSSSAARETPPETTLVNAVRTAWAYKPSVAINLVQRFHSQALLREVRWLVLNFPEKTLDLPDALEVLLGPSMPTDVSFQLKYLLYWAPVNPMTAVTYFLPAYGNHPFIVQYAMRALESHSVDITFFYVPQIVQTLRYDVLEYVERYIVETAKFSQLFAHQIIWNMKANAYKDDNSEIPDPIKPNLDKVMGSLISSFSPEDRTFYEKEFSFFNDVTDISGKLKPYIKRSKQEKKEKIEEELRKIKVEVGVYLPSNPDGVVIGIDRKSGKPLQSHAKAPYMATFRIKKESPQIQAVDEEQNGKALTNGNSPLQKHHTESWQSAIFKVGDDCRQDVLILQIISAFRGIFHDVGLDVFVFPYRVTATAPGCGVIDVLPNSISRDMLGREAVNGLYDYFVSKYGGEDSIRFQEARSNFVKSMAAYSIISYLLQLKDRHNGNIMIDDAGHIIHIDFGFCFDIAPGGVRFERAPFKLTPEMISVMGGSVNSQSYRWFEELSIKAFLASRRHCEHLVHMVTVMLESSLPCFKPQTIQHFRDRFVLEKSETEAADFMKGMIQRSYHSYSTKGYDWFQLMTNGIPY